MYSSKLLILLLMIMFTFTTILSLPTPHDNLTFHGDDHEDYYQSLDLGGHHDDDHSPQNNKEVGGFLVQEARRFIRRTCDKYPRVCVSKGDRSAHPDCCKKKCVNVMKDRFNCGRCGRKCKYSEVCCNGWCVNPSWNERHCGNCNHKCKKGSLCHYGMCSYA